MTNISRLVDAVFEKQLILLRRYWLNTVMMLVAMYLVFAVAFFGGQTVGGDGIEETLDVIVISFFLFMAASAAYFEVAQSVMQEAQWGTLEQLYMSPFGIGRIMAVKTIFNIVFSNALALGLLAIMLLTTDRSLAVDVFTVIPLLVVTILPAVGIGYAVAGLSLLYKRIENVQQLLQFGFIGFIAASGTVHKAVLPLLPMSIGSELLMQAMIDGTKLWGFSPLALLAVTLNGVFYLGAGYVVFQRLVERTRKLGVMGHY